jgi:hypothetical protein
MLGQNEYYATMLALGDIKNYIEKLPDPYDRLTFGGDFVEKVSKFCKKCDNYEKSAKFIEDHLPTDIPLKEKLSVINPAKVSHRRKEIYYGFINSLKLLRPSTMDEIEFRLKYGGRPRRRRRRSRRMY